MSRDARRKDPGRWRTAERLHAAALHLLRDLRRLDLESGIGPARLSALSVLVFGGPRTLGALAEAEQVTPATMSRVVRGLEDAGLARRRADPRDGRAVRIRATAAGRRSLERARRRRIGALDSRLVPLGPADLRRIEAALPALEKIARGRPRA